MWRACHTHTQTHRHARILWKLFCCERSLRLRCRLFVAAVELKALACYTLWNQLQSCQSCHAPPATTNHSASAPTSVYVCLGEAAAHKVPGKASSGRTSERGRCQKSRRERESPGACPYHKLQLEIVRNYIKFLLPHMKWKRCSNFLKRLSLRDYPHANCSHGILLG